MRGGRSRKRRHPEMQLGVRRPASTVIRVWANPEWRLGIRGDQSAAAASGVQWGKPVPLPQMRCKTVARLRAVATLGRGRPRQPRPQAFNVGHLVAGVRPERPSTKVTLGCLNTSGPEHRRRHIAYGSSGCDEGTTEDRKGRRCGPGPKGNADDVVRSAPPARERDPGCRAVDSVPRHGGPYRARRRPGKAQRGQSAHIMAVETQTSLGRALDAEGNPLRSLPDRATGHVLTLGDGLDMWGQAPPLGHRGCVLIGWISALAVVMFIWQPMATAGRCDVWLPSPGGGQGRGAFANTHRLAGVTTRDQGPVSWMSSWHSAKSGKRAR
jgi:hypothetical protein